MFTALTFNMQNGEPWDENSSANPSVHLEGTLAFLEEQNADVIFLQEVERGHDGGRQVEPPPNFTWLQEHLSGYDAVFAYPRPNPDEIPFGLGLAIFSRTPLRDFRRVDLPSAEVFFPYAGSMRRPSSRLLIGAETEIVGQAVTLFNTHLQAYFMLEASSDTHREQRDLVAREVAAVTGPALLGGDFNSAPGESLVTQFRQTRLTTCQSAEVTWRREPYVLDHLFFNPALRPTDCRVVPTLASDHHAVRAEFTFTS